MNDSPTSADPDDPVIAEILAQAAGGGHAVILDGIARHPHLAARILDLYRLQRSLHTARPGDSLMPGELLGDFHILRKVGGGGMGEVYEAEQLSLGRRKVALKVIRPDRATEAMRERFQREQRILARLHQTHIVPIHVAGEEGRLHYLVMPFIDGAALHDVIAAVQHLQPGPASSVTTLIEEAVRHRSGAGEATTPAASPRSQRLASGYFRLVAGLMADVAEAVKAVHQAGFLHRDLKPGNLMVDRQGKVWIIDFGLACEFAEAGTPSAPGDRGTETPRAVSSVAGTPQYMAPEQREGKADRRSDVWALGATFYELAYLKRAADRQRAGGKGEGKRVPADLSAICERALQEEPGRRYSSAGELARDLRRWLAHEPTEPRGATLWRWTWLLVRRNPERAAAVVGLILALVAILGGGLLLQRQEAERARERADAAEEREAAFHRAERLQELAREPVEEGWSDAAWDLVRQAPRGRRDEELRALAITTLEGPDLSRESPILWDRVGGSSVAFDREGKQLLMGGLLDKPAHLADNPGGRPRSVGQSGPCLVAFSRDGTPLQLIQDSGNKKNLHLWDVRKRRPARTFLLPGQLAALALTPDGALAAASAGGQVLVWDTDKGQQLPSIQLKASTLALAPDGTLLAASEGSGRIRVYQIASGEPLVELPGDRARVQSFCFFRDVREDGQTVTDVGRWGLASAYEDTSIVIWDLKRKVGRSRSFGSEHYVTALVPAPDNMTLASGGLSRIHFWDIATGKVLVRSKPVGEQTTALAFAHDGRRLAYASSKVFASETASGVLVYMPGRGLSKLYRRRWRTE